MRGTLFATATLAVVLSGCGGDAIDSLVGGVADDVSRQADSVVEQVADRAQDVIDEVEAASAQGDARGESGAESTTDTAQSATVNQDASSSTAQDTAQDTAQRLAGEINAVALAVQDEMGDASGAAEAAAIFGMISDRLVALRVESEGDPAVTFLHPDLPLLSQVADETATWCVTFNTDMTADLARVVQGECDMAARDAIDALFLADEEELTAMLEPVVAQARLDALVALVSASADLVAAGTAPHDALAETFESASTGADTTWVVTATPSGAHIEVTDGDWIGCGTVGLDGTYDAVSGTCPSQTAPARREPGR